MVVNCQGIGQAKLHVLTSARPTINVSNAATQKLKQPRFQTRFTAIRIQRLQETQKSFLDSIFSVGSLSKPSPRERQQATVKLRNKLFPVLAPSNEDSIHKSMINFAERFVHRSTTQETETGPASKRNRARIIIAEIATSSTREQSNYETSQPLRYSLRRYLSASEVLVTFRLAASHSRALPLR